MLVLLHADFSVFRQNFLSLSTWTMVMNGNGTWTAQLWMTMPVILCRFCPSVFFYLCTVIPSVWFLELDLAERRSKFNVTQAFGLIPTPIGSAASDSEETLPVGLLSLSTISHRFSVRSWFPGRFPPKCGRRLSNKHFCWYWSLDVGCYQ